MLSAECLVNPYQHQLSALVRTTMHSLHAWPLEVCHQQEHYSTIPRINGPQSVRMSHPNLFCGSTAGGVCYRDCSAISSNPSRLDPYPTIGYQRRRQPQQVKCHALGACA